MRQEHDDAITRIRGTQYSRWTAPHWISLTDHATTFFQAMCLCRLQGVLSFNQLLLLTLTPVRLMAPLNQVTVPLMLLPSRI